MKLATHRIPGLVMSDHEFSVPLDYEQPDAGQITIFGRVVVAPEREQSSLPWLVYFQGGPGFHALRPDSNSGWLKRALKDYRVLLLDQRGTGRSTPVTHQTLARLPSPQAQADYVTHFRADNIVRDAEHVRSELVGKDVPWTALGQSFGGFCVTHYLSAAPQGLREAVITGGLPPLSAHSDDIYRATYRRVLDRNRRYFERYPEDQMLAREIAGHLSTHEVVLPAGGTLSVRRFQQLGIAFGMSDGFERVHYLLENAFTSGVRELSYAFLSALENAANFETNPIYVLLHEPEYCQGQASNWSAERVRAEYPQLNWQPGAPLLFTGEMVYPWMYDDYTALRPLRQAGDILAQFAGWSRLYDIERLQANLVPCAAAVYYDDMYVERTFSEDAAANIGGIRLWVTNEYDHNGLRADGETLLDRLLRMLHGER